MSDIPIIEGARPWVLDVYKVGDTLAAGVTSRLQAVDDNDSTPWATAYKSAHLTSVVTEDGVKHWTLKVSITAGSSNWLSFSPSHIAALIEAEIDAAVGRDFLGVGQCESAVVDDSRVLDSNRVKVEATLVLASRTAA